MKNNPENSAQFYYFIKNFLFCLLLFLCLSGREAASNTVPVPGPESRQHLHLVRSSADFSPIADNSIITKYAELLKTDEAHINKFIKLYAFINNWMGTPYLWGGCSKRGIDCSCFVMTLFDQVFNIKIQRTTFTQFYDKDVALFSNRNQYELGDLIFFKTNISRETKNNRITHVGFYLMNGYFVQSSSAGVNIANLNSGYWKTRIVAAGRLKESYYKKAGIAIPTGEIQESKEIDVEENSDFEPVPFPEDMANIISEYATLLNVPKDKIQVPEVFAFIENNRYAPFNITNRCSNKLQKNICLANTLLKDVFDVDLKAENNEAFLAKNTGKLADKDKLSLLDIVQLKGVKKNSNATITGIFLYNDYFLHMIDGDLAVSSLADSAFKKYTMSYHRFNEDILKRALSNIIEKRKGMVNPDQKNEKPEKEKPVKKQPANLLKKDSTGRG